MGKRSSEDESNVESSARLSSDVTVQERTSASEHERFTPVTSAGQHEEPTLGTSAGQHEGPTPGEQGTKRNTNEQSKTQTERSSLLFLDQLSSDTQDYLSSLQADDTSRHTGREATEQSKVSQIIAELLRDIEVPPSVSDSTGAVPNERRLFDFNPDAPSTSRGFPPVHELSSDNQDCLRGLPATISSDVERPPDAESGLDSQSQEQTGSQAENHDFECPLCDRCKTSSRSELIEHIEEEHEGKDELKCAECNWSCNTGFQFSRHIYDKHKRQKYVCSLCGVVSNTRKRHNSHVNKCRKEKIKQEAELYEKRKKLTECERTASPYFNQLAAGTDAPDIDDLEPTIEGGQILSPSTVLDSPVPIENTDDPQPVPMGGTDNSQPIADTADNSQPRTSSGIRHDQRFYECVLCDIQRYFTSSNGLLAHISHVHQTTKLFCKRCNQEFPYPRALVAHVQNSHEVDPYKCRICGKVFPIYIDWYKHEVKCKNKKAKRG